MDAPKHVWRSKLRIVDGKVEVVAKPKVIFSAFHSLLRGRKGSADAFLASVSCRALHRVSTLQDLPYT
jgi:hypothetical protein